MQGQWLQDRLGTGRSGGGGKEALTGRGERLGTRGLGSRDTHPSALGGQPQQWGDLETSSQEGRWLTLLSEPPPFLLSPGSRAAPGSSQFR